MCVNIYVTSVHGLITRWDREAGTPRKSEMLNDISLPGIFIKKPNTLTILMINQTATLMRIRRVNTLLFRKNDFKFLMGLPWL